MDLGMYGIDVERVLDVIEIDRLGIESVDGHFDGEDGESGPLSFDARSAIVRTNEFVRSLADLEDVHDA